MVIPCIWSIIQTEISNKIFEFDTSEDEYKVSENLGQTSGTINITGITNDEKNINN